MSVSLLLFFPDTGSNPPTYVQANAEAAGSYFNVSSLLRNGYEISNAVFNNEFKHVINKCSVSLANSDDTLFQKLLNNNSIIKFKLYEGAVLTFDGIVRPQLDVTLANGYDTLDLEAVDISYCLDVMTKFPILLQNKKLHDPSNNNNSAIYLILSQLLPDYGFSVPSIASVDTGDTIPLICAPANTSLSDFLEELFFDYGWQFSFIAGVLTPVQWNTSTSTTSGTITQVIDGSLKISRKDVEEDCVLVNAQYCDLNGAVLVDSSGEFSASGSYQTYEYVMSPNGATTLTGLTYIPSSITFQHYWTTVEWVWDWFNSGMKQIGHSKTFSGSLVNGQATVFGSGDDSYTIIPTWGTGFLDKNGNPDSAKYNKISLKIKLNSNHSSTLRRLQVNGTTATQASAVVVKSNLDLQGPKQSWKEYDAKFISGSGATNNGSQFAQRLADALQVNLTSNPLSYSFESDVSFALGGNYQLAVNDTTMNASIPVVSLKIISKKAQVRELLNGSLYKIYSYEGIALSPSVIDSSIIYTPVLTSTPSPIGTTFPDGITQEALEQVDTAISKTGLYMTKDVMGYYDATTQSMTNYFSAYGDFRVGKGSSYMEFDPDTDALTLSGTINAHSGNIGGNTISATSISSPGYSPGDGWILRSDGTAELNSLVVNVDLRSDNYTSGVIGFNLDKATGSAELNNAVFRGAITSTSGAIGGFNIGTTTLESGVPGTARIILDKAANRVSVVDSSNVVKVAMGYLGGLPIQGSAWDDSKTYLSAGGEYVTYQNIVYKSKAVGGNLNKVPGAGTTYWAVSTDTRAASEYGFVASVGNAMKLDGDLSYSNGSMYLQNDASLVIASNAVPVLRMGTKSGTKGFFINEENMDAGTGFQAKLTPSAFYVGNPAASYMDFDSTRSTQLKISGEATSGAFVPSNAGWKLGSDGSAEFNNNLSATNFRTNTIYAGTFDNLRDSQSVPGRVLPAGGSVYYLEGTTFSQTNSMDWATTSGTYAYTSPSKFGSVSLSPSSALSFTKPFDFRTGSVEGWLYLGAYAVATTVAAVTADGGNLVSLIVSPSARTVGGQMMTGTYSASGAYGGASLSLKKIYFNVNGRIYNVADSVNAWSYFAMSPTAVFFGNGATQYPFSLGSTLAPSGPGSLGINLNYGIQLSSLMTATGYAFTLSDMVSSSGAGAPWGQVPNTNILITQAYNGLRMPWAISDPTAIVNGAMYYNTTNNLLRVALNGVWSTVPTITSGMMNVSSALTVSGAATFNSTVTANEVIVSTSMLKPKSAVSLGGATSYDFTGIPSWVQKITLAWTNVKTSGTGTVIFQIGSSGVPLTTAYQGGASYITTTVSSVVMTAGFAPGANAAAAHMRHGSATLTKINSMIWVFAGQQAMSSSAETGNGSGQMGLANYLDTVRITTTTGTDTLTGTLVLMYE